MSKRIFLLQKFISAFKQDLPLPYQPNPVAHTLDADKQEDTTALLGSVTLLRQVVRSH